MRLLLSVLVLLLGWTAVSGATDTQPSTSPTVSSAATGVATPPPAIPSSAAPAVVVPLSGQVDDYNRDDLFRRFNRARAMGARTIILKIDTYGGLVTAGMDISRFLRAQEGIHVVALVDDKAISAGAMIALACDEIVMTSGATLGDCAPIVFDTGGRLEPMPVAERAKAQSPILADFYASAQRNGYDPLLAEAMVRTEAVVHYVESAKGEKRFVDDGTFKQLTADGWHVIAGVPDPIDGPDTLLTVNSDLAQKIGLSTQTVSSLAAFVQARGYNVLGDLSPGAGDRLIAVLGSTAFRFILLTIFLQSLYIVLHAPGHGAAEAVAFACLAVLLGVPLMTGYAQWWQIVMVLGGLALCAFEILVFPGHGVSLIIGVLLVVSGLLLTFMAQAPGSPSFFSMTPQMWHGLETGLMVIAGAVVATFIISSWLGRYLPKIPYFSRLVLTEVSGSPITAVAGMTGSEGQDSWPFRGSIGMAVSDLKTGGVAQFAFGNDTRTAPVVSASGYIEAGARVVVQDVRGTRITVRRVDA